MSTERAGYSFARSKERIRKLAASNQRSAAVCMRIPFRDVNLNTLTCQCTVDAVRVQFATVLRVINLV